MTRFLTATALTLTACLSPLTVLANDTSEATKTAAATSIHPLDVRLSPEQVRADIALAHNAYEDIHPGYKRFTDKAVLDAAWTNIIEQAERQNGLSAGEFYLALSETLALIRCDHTKAELSQSLKETRKTDPTYLPLSWDMVEGRAILTQDAAEGLKAGDEILSVDGRTITEMADALYKYIPFDGYNDHIRDTGIASSSEFMGGAVDHFGSILWDAPAMANLTIARPDGSQVGVTLDRVNYSEWLALQAAPPRLNFSDAVSLETIGERAAILNVDTFVNYRTPVDPYDIYDPVFETLKSEGREQLILDLRRNGGGSNDAANALLSYFIDSPQRLTTAELFATNDHSDYEDYIQTWNKRAINPPRIAFKKRDDGYLSLRTSLSDSMDRIKPSKFGFDGKLIILTNRTNSSGSTNIIAALDHLRDVTLIGEKTGGNPTGATAGTIFFLTLPESGFVLRIPIVRAEINSGDRPDGVGLVPDIFAPDTVESVRAGTDPALEAALALFEG